MFFFDYLQSTTTQTSPAIERFTTDYDSGYMSQSVLNRTSSYASCYSAVATTMPIPSMLRHGSIESLLHGHSKSNPANARVLVRKNFEPFAQAHIAVTKGTIVTALFSRGPWLYVCIESTGQTGYIPRIICSLYKNSYLNDDKPYFHHHLSLSSTDSSSNKDDELDLTTISTNNEKHFIRPYKQQPPQQINRYLSHSSAIINDQQKTYEYPKKRLTQMSSDDRERRNTCTIPQPLLTANTSSKDRRLTLSSINWPIGSNHPENVPIHQTTDHLPTTNNNTNIITNPLQVPRDTDSSSTQDSGYSESTPYFLIQQTTPDNEQTPKGSNLSKVRKEIFLFLSPVIETFKRSAIISAEIFLSLMN